MKTNPALSDTINRPYLNQKSKSKGAKYKQNNHYSGIEAEKQLSASLDNSRGKSHTPQINKSPLEDSSGSDASIGSIEVKMKKSEMNM
jgi:hypothetical protein